MHVGSPETTSADYGATAVLAVDGDGWYLADGSRPRRQGAWLSSPPTAPLAVGDEDVSTEEPLQAAQEQGDKEDEQQGSQEQDKDSRLALIELRLARQEVECEGLRDLNAQLQQRCDQLFRENEGLRANTDAMRAGYSVGSLGLLSDSGGEDEDARSYSSSGSGSGGYGSGSGSEREWRR
eukprot:COSAG04_NODE_913_length_9463_cov_71.705575_17_plen_180_part_00